MIAMFLEIPPQELIEMELPETTPQKLFDEQIFRLHEQGLNYAEIARQMGASYNYVKVIAYNKPKTTRPLVDDPRPGGVKPRDWKVYDEEMLPRVRSIITEMMNNYSRPIKINKVLIARKLGIPYKQLDNMPLCLSEIKKHYESQEQYWAREIVWAVNKIIASGELLNWRHLRDLTNMRRCNFKAALNHIQDKRIMEIIKDI